MSLLRHRGPGARRSVAPGPALGLDRGDLPAARLVGEIPYGIGVVEFPEGIRVIGRLTESNPAALVSDQEMELEVVPLCTDDDGNDVVTYAFSPVGAP